MNKRQIGDYLYRGYGTESWLAMRRYYVGILLDTSYWANVLNKLSGLKPTPGQKISEENAEKIRRISCEALSLVINDKEYLSDLENSIALAKSANFIDDIQNPNFAAFFLCFMRLEDKILADANVNTIASRDLNRDIALVAKSPDVYRLENLDGKISFLQKLACDANAADDPRRPVWQCLSQGVGGLGLTVINSTSALASVVTLGPVGVVAVATVSAVSTGYGFNMLTNALGGRW